MHSTIAYTGPEASKRFRALRDIGRWLGHSRFRALNREFRRYTAADMPEQRFSMFCGIAGISGYPVTVWHEALFGPSAQSAAPEQTEAPKGTNTEEPAQC